ncbi:MAG: hypothetical protein AAAC50_19420 [Rhizobium altiplani]
MTETGLIVGTPPSKGSAIVRPQGPHVDPSELRRNFIAGNHRTHCPDFLDDTGLAADIAIEAGFCGRVECRWEVIDVAEFGVANPVRVRMRRQDIGQLTLIFDQPRVLMAFQPRRKGMHAGDD